jgi:peptidoglycan/xylan/chitin deacetylase (PgdA/CDA1 family)
VPNYYSSLPAFRELFRTGTPILTYHKVGPRPGRVRLKGLYLCPELFRRQMRELAAAGFTAPAYAEVVPFSRAPAARIGITFDDGFRNVFEHALAPLAEHGFRAIQFLVADLLGKTNEWEQREGEAREPLMDAAQVRDWLAAGHAIGSHTLTHPHLSQMPPAAAREEITASRKKLEDQFGVPVTHFCYPYGDWSPPVRDAVAAAGYTSACTTQFGVNDAATPGFELRRVTARYPSRNWKTMRAWFQRLGKFGAQT